MAYRNRVPRSVQVARINMCAHWGVIGAGGVWVLSFIGPIATDDPDGPFGGLILFAALLATFGVLLAVIGLCLALILPRCGTAGGIGTACWIGTLLLESLLTFLGLSYFFLYASTDWGFSMGIPGGLVAASAIAAIITLLSRPARRFFRPGSRTEWEGVDDAVEVLVHGGDNEDAVAGEADLKPL